MRKHTAFTMIELIFVIIVMGIIGKFGVEFLAEAYKSFIYTKINNTLQNNSESAIEFISSRLEHRIKDSVIARTSINNNSFDSISQIDPDEDYLVLEWVSSDIDGLRGNNNPFWSGIIDLDHTDANATNLISPETNTTAISNLIDILSHGNSSIDDAALYFIGSNSNINGFGWNGVALDQTNNMHPINSGTNPNEFTPRNGGLSTMNSFSNVDIYEYYKLAWTANAVVIDNYDNTTKTFDLVYYFDYQPWDGELFYTSGKNIKKFTIMKNVSTFRFTSVGSILKIQVCSKSTLINGTEGEGGYSLCKEKTIF